MKRSCLTLALSCLAGSPAALASHMSSTTLATGSGGSINTESAVPLPAGDWSFSLRYEDQRFHRLSDDTLLGLVGADPEADLHSVESVRTTLFNVSYGFNDNLTLSLSLPTVERTDIHAPHFDAAANDFEIEQHGDSKGLGDARLFGLWRFAQSEDASTALIFGIKAPTGKDDDTAVDGEVFEQEFQPGSGSWDGLIGIAYSRGFDRVSLDTSATYSLVGQGSQQTDLGNLMTYNAGLSYRLGSGPGLDWHVVIEANGVWRDKLTQDGVEEHNSGGHWMNIAPGIVAGRDKWSVFANVAFPVVNNPGGVQDEQDYRVQIGFQFGL